jgi:hypothetical protein
MDYNVKTIRVTGLDARWTRTRKGAPIIAARDSSRSATWFVIDADMWKRAAAVGIRQAFREYTLLGDMFSIPA